MPLQTSPPPQANRAPRCTPSPCRRGAGLNVTVQPEPLAQLLAGTALNVFGIPGVKTLEGLTVHTAMFPTQIFPFSHSIAQQAACEL